jgi:hypothetical protein
LASFRIIILEIHKVTQADLYVKCPFFCLVNINVVLLRYLFRKLQIINVSKTSVGRVAQLV